MNDEGYAKITSKDAKFILTKPFVYIGRDTVKQRQLLKENNMDPGSSENQLHPSVFFPLGVTNQISRIAAKISFNSQIQSYEIENIGKNKIIVSSTVIKKGEKCILNHLSLIIIGNERMHFQLPFNEVHGKKDRLCLKKGKRKFPDDSKSEEDEVQYPRRKVINLKEFLLGYYKKKKITESVPVVSDLAQSQNSNKYPQNMLIPKNT